MKKPIRIAVLLVALVTSLFVFAACKTGSGKDKTNVDGKYYLYEDGALNKSEYFDLSDGVWRDEDGASGTYAFTDGTIVFYTELFGENSELCSGNISEGTLTITVGGITKNYRTDKGDIPYEEGTKLETPVLSVSVDTVKWDAVAGAKKYVLTVDGTENELDVSAHSFTIENISVGEHSVSLVAKAEKNRYDSDSAGMRFDFDLFASGSGTSDNPYGIANAAHLANIAVFPDKNYVVKRDNDFSDAVLAVEMPAVDDKKIEFSGSIKAEKDAVIDGAKIDRTLFDLGENAVIDGLVLKNIVSTENSSPLFGLNKGNIVNSSLEGEFTGYYSAVNPIFVRSNKGIIKNCSFGGDMTGFVTAVGENSGTIEAFRSSVTLTADNTKSDKSPCSLKFGLVCSYNVGTIKNAAVTGVFTFNLVYEGFVLGTSSEAAIASVVGENYGIIEKSLSSVDIGGTIYDKYDRINVGGFVGKTNVVNDTVSSVSDCSYNGTLSLIVDNQSGIMIAGGFVGNAFKGDISHSGVERQVTVNGRTFDPSFIGWSIASGKYGGFAGANFDASIADSYAGGLNIVGKIGEARYADFAITLNSGTNTSCFTAASDEILLDEDHWFIPRNGSPKVLAVSDVGAIEGVCEFTKNKNVLSWNAVPDAEYYEYEFYGRTYFTDKTSVTLEFTRGGDTIVKVRPCSDSRIDGEWRQTTFDVKTLDFAVEKGGKTENITFYIVVGDMYTVADFGCEREGYTFIGWLCGGEYAAGDEITVTSDMTFVPKFEINEYRLTVYMQKRSYDGRGLDYYLADDKQVTFGESLGLPVPALSGFDKAGYTFDGWFVSDRYFNDATRFDSDAMPARDLSLWVKFTLKTFNVKLNPNYDGATVETHVRNYNFTVRVADFGTLQRKGYTFLGWYTDKDGINAAENFYMPLGDAELFAKWSLNRYNITVNGNDGVFDEIPSEYTVESDAVVLPSAKKKGYTFVGWRLNDESGYRSVIGKGEFAEDISLEAIFTADKYKVSFDYEGVNVKHLVTFDVSAYAGLKAPAAVELGDGDTLTSPSQGSIYTYVYRGWYLTPDFSGEPFDFATGKIYGDTTLYLKADKISDDVVSAYEKASGTAIGIILGKDTVPNRTGTFKFITGGREGEKSHRFDIYVSATGTKGTLKGLTVYYTDLVSGTKYGCSVRSGTAGTTVKYYADTAPTLPCGRAYALTVSTTGYQSSMSVSVSRISDPITYDGEGSGATIDGDYNLVDYDSVIGTLPVIDKFGYKFEGWKYGDDFVTAETVMKYDKDITLTPVLTLLKARINYVLDGGENPSDAPEYYTVEESAKLKTPTKEGYEFSGWYSDSGFTKVVYQWTIAYTADTCNGYTVYACFMKLYRVTHVMPDFAPQVPEKLVSGYSYTLGKLPDVEGYKAIGWCSDEALSNIITYVRLTGDVKVYAYYEKYHHAVFETGNGTLDGEYDCKYTKLDTFDVSDIKANSPKNYIFTGWKISDGDGEVITEIPLGTDRDVTLVAVYEHATEGLIYTLNSDKKSYSVKFPGSADDLGETEDVAIRAYYNGLPVTKIAASTGEYHINKLIIPYGITEICSKAFFGRTFDYVYIPSSVTTLGTKAFFVIEQSLNMCPKHYFNIAYGGEKLPENTADKWWNVGYEETGTYVKQEYWYSPILNVKRYVFSPDEDTVEFNDGTFGIVKDRCGKTFVDLENRTEKITYIAPFAYGGSIYEIRIPEGCTVDRSAFYNCVDMRAVTSKTEFDLARAFGTVIDRQYSGSLDLTYDVKHITLSASATFVKSLTLIGTETIVDSAFSGWSKLEEVNLPDTLTGVGTGIFEKAIISKAVVPGIALECLSKDYLTDLTITGGDIPASAFQGYKLLVSVKFGNDVKTVGDQAFADCPALTGIYTDSIESWCDIDFATKDANPLAYAGYLYVGGGQVVDLVIDGVADEIKPYAFYGIKIDSLILSDVGTIGESAFEKSRLKTLTVKEGVVNIGKWAFIYCTSLTDVSLSDSVREIGYAAFSHCNNLINLDLGNGVAVIGQSAFAWSYNLTTVVLGDGVTTIGEGAFTSARVVRFGKNIKTIDANAFRAAYSSVVKEIHIVDLASWCSVNMTGAIAININTTLYVGDEPITSLVIPDEVTRISDFVFAGLNITEVNIHRGVTFIGKMAFMRCADLTSVNFDGTVEEWNNIEKTDDWDDYAGKYTVHCKDGDIAPVESA